VVLDPRHPHPLAEELVRQRAVLGVVVKEVDLVGRVHSEVLLLVVRERGEVAVEALHTDVIKVRALVRVHRRALPPDAELGEDRLEPQQVRARVRDVLELDARAPERAQELEVRRLDDEPLPAQTS
jgi:hypothetical protein